jgi:divalent metal cation (Fe/Co/Zn/Cd) transporter
MSIRYDPLILQKFADRLYSTATSVVILCVIIGVVIGGVGGFQIGGIIGAVIGLVILGALGFAIGLSIAFHLKLRAQSVLCQKQIEENTRKASGMSSIAPVVERVVPADEQPPTDATIQEYERWKQSHGQ